MREFKKGERVAIIQKRRDGNITAFIGNKSSNVAYFYSDQTSYSYSSFGSCRYNASFQDSAQKAAKLL